MSKAAKVRTEISADGTERIRSSRRIAMGLGLTLAVILGPLAGVASSMDDDPQYPDEPTTTVPKETPRHKAVVNGLFKLVDDDWSDDVRLDSTFQTTAYFGTSTQPRAVRDVKSACAGGEMFGRLWMTFKDTGPDSAQVLFEARLYEGDSCSTTDLDGQAYYGWVSLKAGQASSFNFLVYNQDEHGYDPICAGPPGLWECPTDYIRLVIDLQLIY